MSPLGPHGLLHQPRGSGARVPTHGPVSFSMSHSRTTFPSATRRLPDRLKERPSGSRQGSLADRPENVAVEIEHRDALRRLLGHVQPVVAHRDPRWPCQAADGQDPGPVAVELDNPRVAPVGHVQVAPAVPGQVLGAQQEPVRPALLPEGRDLVAVGPAPRDPVAAVLGDEQRPVGRFQDVLGLVESLQAALQRRERDGSSRRSAAPRWSRTPRRRSCRPARGRTEVGRRNGCPPRAVPSSRAETTKARCPRQLPAQPASASAGPATWSRRSAPPAPRLTRPSQVRSGFLLVAGPAAARGPATSGRACSTAAG